MNRLVLIGNGFDLAHGLPTSYKDFINWYWDQRMHGFKGTNSKVSEDILCKLEILSNEETWNTFAFRHNYFRANHEFNFEYKGKDIIKRIRQDEKNYKVTLSPLLERIIEGVESKTWAGIEQDYYDILKEYAFRDKKVNPVDPPIKALNQQLRFVQEKLIEYLKEVCAQKPAKIHSVEAAMYAPFKKADMSIQGEKELENHIKHWKDVTQKDSLPIEMQIDKYGWDYNRSMSQVHIWQELPERNTVPDAFSLPDDIMFLNFNYTDTVQLYIKPRYQQLENHIHGDINDPKTVIFGYGDELDDKFKELKEHKNNACLSHIKSILYLEAPNYRRLLSFIESAPFQVLIMGHSCGNSDRTLLNTIFEHPNCVSIKPYYYEKEDGTDNYTELAQHISRNFNDMKLMRGRVVNKTQCEPLVNKNKTK